MSPIYLQKSNLLLRIMRLTSLYLLLILVTVSTFARGEKEKPDQSPVGYLKKDIQFLTAEQTEGRLTGSKGEQICADYIAGRFAGMKIDPYQSKYIWDFTAKMGMQVGNSGYFKVFGKNLVIGRDVVLMPYSKGIHFNGSAMPNVDEADNVWLVSLKKVKMDAASPQKGIYEYAKSCEANGAASVVFLNDVNATLDLSPSALTSFESINIPVAVMNFKAYTENIQSNLKKDWIDIDARMGYEEATVTGHNVAAMIDNKSPLTVVIAAHYDHLGNMGERYVGADNNASGVGALLLMAQLIKASGLKGFNYLFVAFSGKEQDFQGSTAFLKQHDGQLGSFACMIDLDMMGRYSNTLKEINIQGAGTAAEWMGLLQKANKGYNLKVDSSGMSFSDSRSFYQQGIPVLRFSTGYHIDYMKPSDTENKINYLGEFEVIGLVHKTVIELDKLNKLSFRKTDDLVAKLDKLKSNLGIIIDPTYTGNGIRIAACFANQSAAISGMQSGDVIMKIGDYPIIDTDDYVDCLTRSQKGREAGILVKRDKSEFKFFLTL
ncbi:MAG: M28 family peptidase [Chitinophagaceae bacterium]|nr:M28 family peptidase [Chitinophagaceae bacterium]